MKSPIAQFTAIILIGAGIITLTSWVVNRTKKPDVIEKQVLVSAPTCPHDFNEYRKLVESNQSVRLIDNVDMYAIDGKFVNGQQAIISRLGNDQIACGYLYVRARKDGRALEDAYNSVFISSGDFGGHILSKKGSIDVPNPETNKTEFILPLDAISYLPSIPFNPNAQNYKINNWVNLLNVSNQTKFFIGLSVPETNGVVEEVRIAYKCWNPQTGKESTNCQLSNGR